MPCRLNGQDVTEGAKNMANKNKHFTNILFVNIISLSFLKHSKTLGRKILRKKYQIFSLFN